MFKFLKNLFGNKKNILSRVVQKTYQYDDDTVICLEPLADDTVALKVGSTRDLTDKELREIVKQILKREGLADV